MGKVVMPKNSALLGEIESALKIYYDENGWLENSTYKDRLKAMIGDDQYSSSYTKKIQIMSYFGFTVWEDINNKQSRRRITESGKKMYAAIYEGNHDQIAEILMDALERIIFGRNNFGCPDSDSDIEPPNLFIRASIDLKYLTYKEFAFILWKLADVGGNYTDTILEIIQLRNTSGIILPDDAIKYSDCKPIMALVRWGFLCEDPSSSEGGKHICVSPKVLKSYFKRLKSLKIYNIDKEKTVIDYNVNKKVDGATNRIFYGVPGCGKSYTVNQRIKSDGFEKDIRVVFHPDYTYYDFVGQITPRVEVDGEESRLKYVFTPGPFTQILKFAYDNPDKKCILIIEELNRGNAPAIFGELFQLLDRSEEAYNLGESSYGVTNYDIAENVYGDREHEVRIPSNLSIYATMNTSDQNVFTLDTAFQRRWFMNHIPNKFEGKHAAHLIEGTNISWGAFATVINDRLHDELGSLCSTEDKSLGAYFATDKDLESKERFSEKILKYLWDDAFKMSREAVFGNDCKSLDDVIELFQRNSNGLKSVLQDSVYKNMVETSRDFLEADVEMDTENSIGE